MAKSLSEGDTSSFINLIQFRESPLRGRKAPRRGDSKSLRTNHVSSREFDVRLWP